MGLELEICLRHLSCSLWQQIAAQGLRNADLELEISPIAAKRQRIRRIFTTSNLQADRSCQKPHQHSISRVLTQ